MPVELTAEAPWCLATMTTTHRGGVLARKLIHRLPNMYIARFLHTRQTRLPGGLLTRIDSRCCRRSSLFSEVIPSCSIDGAVFCSVPRKSVVRSATLWSSLHRERERSFGESHASWTGHKATADGVTPASGEGFLYCRVWRFLRDCYRRSSREPGRGNIALIWCSAEMVAAVGSSPERDSIEEIQCRTGWRRTPRSEVGLYRA